MLRRIQLITCCLIIVCLAPLTAQDANNKNWRVSWQARSGQFANLIRSYTMVCGSDMDRDGKAEILLNCNETTCFSLLEAVKNDSFNLVWQIERPHQSELRSLAVTDWDLDGNQEISVILDAAMGDMPGAVYEWDGTDNGFPPANAPTSEFDLPRNTAGAVCVEASSILAQLDADPGPEWILPYFRGSGISMVIMELATGSFEGYGWDFDYLDTSPGQVRTAEVGDLDNDGSMDIVAMDREKKMLRFIKNTGVDSYQMINTIRADNVSSTYTCNAVESLRILNFDGGQPELYLFDDGGRIYVMTHQGDLASPTQIKFSKILDLSDVSIMRGAAAGDLDRDGKPDLYFGNSKSIRGVIIYDLEYEGGDVTSPNSYKLYEVWRHDFSFGGTLEVGNIRLGNQLKAVNDLDGDSYPELVISFGTTQTNLPAVLILENTSEPTRVTELSTNEKPESCTLQQNYPNPFNPTTKICYQVPRASRVRLDIFSALGQHLANLVDADQVKGNYTVPFTATSLSGGIYFYRLTTGDFTVQKKMLYLK
jgi:hypothetical protein